MDELVGRVVAAAGTDAGTATHAIGLVLAYLKQHGPQLEVGQLVAAMPGADQVIQNEAESAPGAGIVGAPSGAGIMGLVGQLSAIGLDMNQMQEIGRELFAFAREKAGEDVVGAIVAAIPGLSHVI